MINRHKKIEMLKKKRERNENEKAASLKRWNVAKGLS
jgi:hypothetical protein